MQVCECMNDSSHVFKGRHLDGVTCPVCCGPVLLKPYDKEKDKSLPYYRDLKKQYNKKFIQSECLRCKHVQKNECNNKAIDVFVCEKCNGASVDTWTKNIKYLAKPKSTITIDLNFDDKSKLKLRAIAKHVGALADELDRIDNGIVKDGPQMQIEKLKEIIISIGKVNGKSAEEIDSALKDFTTRIEGSNWL
ncbi:hypothetical protein FC756_23165 [Lysinibacillus mangiferihumi]|uniref:Uncharacterized protein n=1 Tax=Lysinibacillus mangiferihumi TaxID=1130819 RepID=A0A4U2XZS7_9BACI|nr:hypothetical protein [Lysinibacillus mangiferihumi]TKI53530.1 hypothetical protein FC756_23165 [Lysinibacillus mangiferihumi]